LCRENVEVKLGNRLPLKNINPGTEIFEIELRTWFWRKINRSAGSFAVMMGIEGDYAIIKMPSGEIRKIHKECYASIGRVSNSDHRNVKVGKSW
jgi:large subunit ribosomal protein L2